MKSSFVSMKLSLLLLLKTIYGLDCSTLPKNTICGSAFEGFPILNKTVKEFNDTLVNSVANPIGLASSLVNRSICLAPAINNEIHILRYQVSFQCAYYVNQAINNGCPVPPNTLQPNGPLICSAQCQIAASSVQALALNSDVCPNGANIDVASYIQFCTNTTTWLPQNHDTCFNGSPDESQFCGFPRKDIASSQCASLPNDTCCKALYSPISSKNSTSTNSTSINSTSKNSDTNGLSSKSKLTIILSAVFSFISLIILIACAVYYFRKHKRGQKKNIQSSNSSLTKIVQEDIADKRTSVLDYYVKQPPLSYQESTPQNSRLSEIYSAAPAIDKKGERPKSYAASIIEKNDYRKSTQSITSIKQEEADSNNLPQRVYVLHAYESSMDDELTLKVGTYLIMIKKFDDGWALGVDPITGAKGAFPQVCVTSKNNLDVSSTAESILNTTLDRSSISSRDSSAVLKKIQSTGPSKPKNRFSSYLIQPVGNI